VQLVPLVQQGLTAQSVQQDQLAHKAFKESKVFKESKATSALLVQQEPMAQSVLRAQQGQLAQLAQMA
jgi:hypothetical protein